MTTELTQEQLSKIEQEEQDKLDKLSHELNQKLKNCRHWQSECGQKLAVKCLF